MKIVTITSGKGGVGKTNIAVNLAISLARKGYKTCLFDADIGLANVNILMGIVGKYTLEDVISGSKILKEVIIKNWNSIDIIPGSSGVEQFETLEKKELENIITQFSNLDEYDYIIVDTGAGISKAVVSFCLASSILIVAVVPEPTSLTDAYSLLKVLKFNGFKNQVNIIANRVKSETLGKKVFEKFKNTVLKYINLDLSYLGSIPEDQNVLEAVSMQSPFILNFPDSPASKKIFQISGILAQSNNENPDISEETSFDSFIKSCSNFFQSSLKLIRQKEQNNHSGNIKSKQIESAEAENKAAVQKLNLLIEKNHAMLKELEALKTILLKKECSKS
ncbi:MAG: MinD/ParA family protein [Desulfobacteraceae bacterium]|nr:MinD/ParA family protein [Desulfobacteraceae bacterium]